MLIVLLSANAEFLFFVISAPLHAPSFCVTELHRRSMNFESACGTEFRANWRYRSRTRYISVLIHAQFITSRTTQRKVLAEFTGIYGCCSGTNTSVFQFQGLPASKATQNFRITQCILLQHLLQSSDTLCVEVQCYSATQYVDVQATVRF